MNKVLRKIFWINIFFTLMFSTRSNGQCPAATATTFSVDLSSKADTVWENISNRSGTACAGTNCIRFEVMLNPGTDFLIFDVYNPVPPGGNFYQADCGALEPIGSPVCVSTLGIVCLTFCKPGGDFPTYRITAIDTNTTIVGNVSYSGGPVNSGFARLLSYLPGQHMPVVDSVEISSGSFAFLDVPPGDYLVYMKADTGLYPNLIPTYYNARPRWQAADVITVNPGCGQTDSINTTMLEITSTTGNGYINGHILQDSTYRAPGDPIPGVDVGLELEPSGIIVQVSETDSNGFYAFNNIPSGSYMINVGIPGLNMDSTYHFTVSSTDTLFTDLDFKADSNSIYPIGSLVTSLHDENVFTGLKIYPNPFSGAASIVLGLENIPGLKVSVFSVLGEKVTEFYEQKPSPGKVLIFDPEIYGFGSGIYILHFEVNGHSAIYKLIRL